MDHVHHFIKTWNKGQQDGQTVEMFLDNKIDLPNPTMIRDHLASLSEDEREPVRKQLMSILQEIEAHAARLSEGLADVDKQMAKARSAQNVCVSYERVNDIHPANDEDE